MKILYAVQGTGNGHISRAMEVIPILQKKGEVDVLISGTDCDLQLPFEVKYKLRGLGFVFGKNGGIDLLATYQKSRLRGLLKEVKSLPVHEYDLVISDFEPVSAWACYLRNRPCIGLSHQAGVMNKKAPEPKRKDRVGRAILRSYAPATVRYGFHFENYDDNVYTPVIRQQVRRMTVTNDGHYTVYLPAYSEKRIIQELIKFEGVKWEIFSKHFTHNISSESIRLFRINNETFLQSMASSAGVLCGAGFETPAEALYLEKKLLVIPMKHQYEQHCNAEALRQMGVPVIKSLKEKNRHVIARWIASTEKIKVDYPDETQKIIDDVIDAHGLNASELSIASFEDQQLSVKKMRGMTIKRILLKLS
jgi:uncharacterized protein (TIGR00661 family)